MRPRITEHVSEANRDVLTAIGTATWLAAKCENYRKYKIESVSHWIESPIQLSQIRFFYDPFGNPMGYVIWAWLAQDVAEKLISDPDFSLHFSEWNEGDQLWIIDFVAPFGHAMDISRALPVTLPAANSVYFLRGNRVKVISRRASP